MSAIERGLKNTLLVYPREILKLMLPFPEYSGPERLYLYHRHIPEHEDAGMMGPLTVEA